MAEFEKKVYLYHGDCDYLIFKKLKELRKDLTTQNVSINELFGSKSLNFKEVYTTLQSSDLFLSSSAVIIRDLVDGKSFYPFIEDLTEFLNGKEPLNNSLLLFNFGKVLKTSKLYKAVSKAGVVEEFNQPKDSEILDVIKKSIAITDDAAQLLLEYTNKNLFIIRNEIKKLQSYVVARNKDKVEESDIIEVCVKLFSQDNVWGIGNIFLRAKLEDTNPEKTPQVEKLHQNLLKNIDSLLANNIPSMQILYSFYQYTLNAIKLKQMIAAGKNYRDCMALGYFFVKEFFDSRNKMNLDMLMKLNSQILNIEYEIKTGQLNDIMGIRKLVLV